MFQVEAVAFAAALTAALHLPRRRFIAALSTATSESKSLKALRSHRYKSRHVKTIYVERLLLFHCPQIIQITTPSSYSLGIKGVRSQRSSKLDKMRGRRSRQCQPRRQGPLAQGNKPHVQLQLMQMYPWPYKDWSCLSWNRSKMKAIATTLVWHVS